MTTPTPEPGDLRAWAGDVVGPRTKGLRLDAPATVADVLAPVPDDAHPDRSRAPRITDDPFSWPLLTLDDAALDHNVGLMARLCPSCPGLAPPGLERSRCSLRSVEGGFEDVREVFGGRCSRSTNSINSSLLKRSRSLRPITPRNQ